ncbi:hypothetical protein [Niallia sp. BSM11]
MMVMTKVARVAVIDSDKRLTTITAIVIKSVIAAMMETVITAASGIGITHSFIPPFNCILYIIFFKRQAVLAYELNHKYKLA